MTAARRVTGWPERLAGYVAARAALPFRWGEHDCITFAAGAVEVVTCWRPGMPTWTDARTALRELRAIGGLVAAVESAGLPELARATLAQRGDVVLIEPELRRSFLAVSLGHVWVAPGAAGLVYGPMSNAACGWKVGHG
jgi:hypothetical protein